MTNMPHVRVHAGTLVHARMSTHARPHACLRACLQTGLSPTRKKTDPDSREKKKPGGSPGGARTCTRAARPTSRRRRRRGPSATSGCAGSAAERGGIRIAGYL